MSLAAGFSLAPAPAVDDGWGERSRGYCREHARHEHAEWRGEGGWGDWYGRGAWGGRGWYQDQGYGYDTCSDNASRSSRRPCSPSRRPRRPLDSGPDDPRSDGRGGSRRRCLSSVGVGGRGSAFACDLRLGLLGGVIDVDNGCLVGLHDSRGYPRCAMVTRGEWLRRYELTLDAGGPVAGPGGPPHGYPATPVDSRFPGGGRGRCGPSPSGAPGLSAADGPPLLAITLPDWGVPPGPPVPIPWAKWEGQHGEVLDTDVPDDCASDGGVTGTESCGTSVTAIDRSPRSGDGTISRPFLGPGGPAVDPSTSPVDEAWLAGGDLVDVVRATGLRDGWAEAQAKITSASARKRPPSWLRCLERITKWVDAAPLPSPVAEARMPPWASCSLACLGSPTPSGSSGLSPGARAANLFRVSPPCCAGDRWSETQARAG